MKDLPTAPSSFSFGLETRIEILLVRLRLHGFLPAEFINKLVLYFESLKRCLVTLDGLLVFAVI